MLDLKSFTNNPSLHLTSLPAGLKTNGDPTEGNPFPKEDPRHARWSEATRVAAGEVCRVNAKFLKARPTLDLEGWSPETFAAWKIAFTLEKFDIWALRGIQVVWTDSAAEAYAQFLVGYAESWLSLQREVCPAVIPVEDFLSELRFGLAERIEHWKGEALRYLAQQKADAEAVDPPVNCASLMPQDVRRTLPGRDIYGENILDLPRRFSHT